MQHKNKQTSMRVSWETKDRFRKHAPFDRASDEETLKAVLDKLKAQDGTIFDLKQTIADLKREARE